MGDCVAWKPEMAPQAIDTNIIKTFENGQMIIIKNGVQYNMLGQEIK